MKVILLVLSCLFISEISAHTLRQIAGINNELVGKVDFDSDGNIYAATTDRQSDHKLYKLNATHQILWKIDLPDVDLIEEMLVGSNGNIYFYFYNTANANRTAAVLRSGSTEVEIIDQISFQLFFLDNNDNLFYYKDNDGVYVLRPGSAGPVQITNLAGFDAIISGQPVTDKSGNIYLSISNLKSLNNSIAVITQETLEEEIPVASFINVLDDPLQQFAVDLAIDEENNLWVTISDGSTRGGIIKKCVNGNSETILNDKDRLYNKMVTTKGKVFIVGSAPANGGSTIYYITLTDNKVVEIPELRNVTADYYSVQGVADSDGHAYFSTYRGEFSSLGKMIVLKPDEINPIALQLETPNELIESVKFDFNENLWIVQLFSLYNVKHGDTVVNLVNDPNEKCGIFEGIHVNFKTEKIYAACVTGLFIVEED